MNMERFTTLLRPAGVALASVMLVAACGAAATPAPPTAPPVTAAPATAAPATSAPATSAPSAAASDVKVATDATIGQILVGGNGMTLYTFAKDTDANKSVCVEDCAKAWPPLVVVTGAQPIVEADVTGAIATYQRDDGTTGVSYNGHPLYYFAADKAPGDVVGEGKGGVWFAARNDGTIPPPNPPSAAPSAGGSPAPSAGASEAAGEEYPLDVAHGAAAIGDFLTGEDGMTLYTFKPDEAAPGKSVCNAAQDCAKNWPPYTLEEDETLTPGDGATGTITMITRDDGTKQVAYNGKPLYYFIGDKKAGDTAGQGLNNVWFVAAP